MDSEKKAIADKTEISGWIKNKRYWYCLSFIVPGIPMFSALMAAQTGDGEWLWFTVLFLYGIQAFYKTTQIYRNVLTG